MKKYFSISNIRLALIFIALIFLYSFGNQKNKNRNVYKSNINFIGKNTSFVQKEMVNKLLIENKIDLKTIKKLEVDLNNLEKTVSNHPMIEKSEVYVSVDGILNVSVTQKSPVARVFNTQGSFYIDKYGNPMPLSENYTARVPILTGDLNKKNKNSITKLLNTIYKDDFLRKNIIAIEIQENNNIIMKNRNFNYVLDFGKTINVEKKFKNYKAFFQKAEKDSVLFKYKKINLKYTQQVVCTK